MAKHIYLYKTVFPFEFPFILFIDKCRDIRILLVQILYMCLCQWHTAHTTHFCTLSFSFKNQWHGRELKMSIIHNILDEQRRVIYYILQGFVHILKTYPLYIQGESNVSNMQTGMRTKNISLIFQLNEESLSLTITMSMKSSLCNKKKIQKKKK